MCGTDTDERTADAEEPPDDPLAQELRGWDRTWRFEAGGTVVILENGHNDDADEQAIMAAALLAELAIAVSLQQGLVELPESVKRATFLSTRVSQEPSRRWNLDELGGVFRIDGLGLLFIDETAPPTRLASLLAIATLSPSTELVAHQTVHIEVKDLPALLLRWTCGHFEGRCSCAWWYQPWAVWVGPHTKFTLDPRFEYVPAEQARERLITLAALSLLIGVRERWLPVPENDSGHDSVDAVPMPDGVWSLSDSGGIIHIWELGSVYTDEGDRATRGRLLSVPLCVLSTLDAPELTHGEPLYLDDPGALRVWELWRQWLLDGLLRSRPVGEA